MTLDEAWAELHAATPRGWHVGRPVHHVERGSWALYAFDQTERVKAGKGLRAWTAQAPTEVDVVREMAPGLSECKGSGYAA